MYALRSLMTLLSFGVFSVACMAQGTQAPPPATNSLDGKVVEAIESAQPILHSKITEAVEPAQPFSDSKIAEAIETAEPIGKSTDDARANTAPDTLIRIFRLSHISSQSAETLLRELMPARDVIVISDGNTNSLVVRGSNSSLTEVESVLGELDRQTIDRSRSFDDMVRQNLESQSNNLSGSPRKKTKPSDRISELKKDYAEKERRSLETAQKLRKPNDRDSRSAQLTKLREQLRREVAEAFGARQQLHQAEIAELQRKILDIQQLVSARERIEAEIIDRRVEDLLNPSRVWNLTDLGASVDGKSSLQRPSDPILPNPISGESPESTIFKVPSLDEEVRSSPDSPLSEIIQRFNSGAAAHPIGKEQPLLTDDEVVASIRWQLIVQKDPKLSAEAIRVLTHISENRRVPHNVSFGAITAEKGPDGGKLVKWDIRIWGPNANGGQFSISVRERYVRAEPTLILTRSLEPEAPSLANGTPLEAAIHGFNSRHQSGIGADQPPLTEDEVIAAIRSWVSKRREVDLTDSEFQAFQAIADARRLPEKSEFEVLTSFRPNDEYEFDAWSVRIVMPRTSNPGWTYAFTIRDRWLTSKKLAEQKISWGPEGKSGLQVGISFGPIGEECLTGQQVIPRFYFRNVGNEELDVSFPRVMTHSYYTKILAVDATGKTISIDQNPDPSGPVGWIKTTMPPGGVHEVSGLSVMIGDVSPDPAFKTVIRAKPGQSCRVHFVVPDFANRDSDKLQTGEIRFTMAPSQ